VTARGRTDVEIDLSVVATAVTAGAPRVLVVDDGKLEGLPLGVLDPVTDVTLERALRGWIRRQTGLEIGHVEQLYTFGDRDRDPSRRKGDRVSTRVITVGYLALGLESPPKGTPGARWRDWYEYFPWEDRRDVSPGRLDQSIRAGLDLWADRNRKLRATRRERIDIAFGLRGSAWDGDRTLERYELLFEAGLVAEGGAARARSVGRPMRLDHRRILATAIGRLRGKIRYRPVVFELLPPAFTLLELQRIVEALAGVRLHKPNFRRLVERGGLVEPTGAQRHDTGGRPAATFRFRRDVLRERPAPGVGLPGAS